MFDLESILTTPLTEAFTHVAGFPAEPRVQRSAYADFQANGALPLARTIGRTPREIAADVVALADLGGVATAEVTGPGFINLRLSTEVLGRMLAGLAADDRLGVPRTVEPEVVTVDYSAPNAAKEMHVGHLRSTIIGDAAVRLLEWQGHTVIRQNHIGEWGTPFGMLIEHLLDLGEAEAAHELSVGDLSSFYQAARRSFDSDDAFKVRARRRVVALQSGDPVTRRLWEVLIGESKKYFATVYSRLEVRLTDDDYDAESSYNDEILSVVDELETLRLLRLSEGAGCVFPTGFTSREGNPLPLIVQKADGGFGYAATDLATIRRRIMALGATRLLYVVGLPQRQHLEMIFEVAREAKWLAPPVRAVHVGHGSVLGTDGRMLRTRAGASVRLVDLLDEAVARAAALIEEKDPDLDRGQRAAVARAVGIGAVKYADLSTDRVKDYVFDLDRMVSFDGNTAPYIQYARARICSIFRRGEVEPIRDPAPVPLAEPAERALAVELLAFGPVVREVAESLEFHRLANYLYGLASAFTTFFEQCPVLRAEGRIRDGRLVLCDLTGRTLATGLALLGISSPDRM